jgi:hypothetical protein
MSMVIGLTSSEHDKESYSLGLSYEIFGRCKLPCGAFGTIKYFLHPSVDGVPEKDWPFAKEVVEPTIYREGLNVMDMTGPIVSVEHRDLEDCQRYTPAEGSTYYEIQRHSACGLIETVTWLRPEAFGATGEGILHRLPEPDLPQVNPATGKGKGKTKHNYDNGRTECGTRSDYRSLPTKYDEYEDRWTGIS